MKNHLNRQWIFNAGLWTLSLPARSKFFKAVTLFFTSGFAQLMLFISKPGKKSQTPKDLAEKWKELMPFDNQDDYKITNEGDDTKAITEIHIHCPLRNSNNIDACNRLMNYDRTLLKAIGGKLSVIESQANSGKKYCKLEIVKIETISAQ